MAAVEGLHLLSSTAEAADSRQALAVDFRKIYSSPSSRRSSKSDLSHRKSLLIIQAQFQRAIGQQEEKEDKFLLSIRPK
jgi:hypothetical protein